MTADTRTLVREYEADLVVESAQQLAENVLGVTLVDPTCAALPSWTPGAHIDLVLGDGLTRQYSLCGDPAKTTSWRVAILKSADSRGGSAAAHDRLSEGVTVRVRGPRNHFPLVRSPRYQFIAGGIGITPLLPMISEAAATGAEWHLLYGGRRRSSMAFAEDVARYGDRVHLAPSDETGRMNLSPVLGAVRPNTLVYCCGPAELLDTVADMCRSWPVGTLHMERFSARPPAADAVDTAFDIVLARAGMTLTVPADKSIFEVVRAAGVSVLGSCLEGICGTCETGVLEGHVDHRDSILNDEEKASDEFLMICVSRCHGQQLTLDL